MSVGNLQVLSDDVLGVILRKLSPADLSRVSRTCKSLLEPCNDDSLWKHLFAVHFGEEVDSPGTSWKEVYRLTVCWLVLAFLAYFVTGECATLRSEEISERRLLP